jgi:cyclomaltodextrinase / maltogenic alpha-amylase / neopullulanase
MSWAADAVFYHIYPLGTLGAPTRNDFAAAPSSRLDALHAWLDPIADLGATAIYLGPVFESTAHGYDTADYFTVDRRLGDRDALARWSNALHQRGLRLVLDGVFNHTGRDFWAFRDVQQHGEPSPYRDWFHLDFGRRSPYGDPFGYQGWHGNYDLVKLNTDNPAVRAHLFAAVRQWVEAYGIDGLRLDAADALDHGFQRDLATYCRSLRADFWLMGEVVHGDYRGWAGPGALDSVTNYELYKALYSSHNDANYFEVAYALNRQSGPDGIYRDLALYTFADNHDVNRVASSLTNPSQLYPLYALLFTAPGIPSIYYGSEYGIEGRRTRTSDRPLRPPLHPACLGRTTPHPELRSVIARLIRLRRNHPALRQGSYRQLHVAHEQLVYLRAAPGEQLVVAVNASGQAADIKMALPDARHGRLVDVLDAGEVAQIERGAVTVHVPPCWARVLRIEAHD